METEEKVEGLIVDERTGQEITKGKIQTLPTATINIDVSLVGTLELSPEAEAVLDEKLNPEDVSIRPDGLVYLDWTWYAERLNRAFGRLSWALIPDGSPQSKKIDNNNVLVVWGHWLIIKGIVIGFAIGETSYRADNNTMSEADAAEGAKSISLSRNCKILGMSLELWNPTWVAEWKKNYAETYLDERGKTKWRKKNKRAAAKTNAIQAAAQNQNQPVTEKSEVAAETKDGYSISELRKAENVNQLTSLTGKTVQEVVAFVSSLDKNKKYSIFEIVSMMNKNK